jgi:precorrin-3B synthase
VLIALPYGRCQADLLQRIADWSVDFGRGILRLSVWRGVAIPHVSSSAAPDLAGLAEASGLIVVPDDPRLGIAACPGAPACTRGTTRTHEDADRIARAARNLLASGMTLHVSGCRKGCAQPGRADLTLIGDQGAYAMVCDGTARDQPHNRLAIDAIAARLAEAQNRTDIMQALSKPQP